MTSAAVPPADAETFEAAATFAAITVGTQRDTVDLLSA